VAGATDKKRRILAVFLLFFVLGGLYNIPLIRHFTKAIPYIRFPVPGYEIQRMNMGDHLNLYYNFWLLKDNLVHLRNPFSDPYQFTYWGKRFFNPQIALFSFLFALFSPLGDVIAFNLVFLLSFALAGGFTYLWLRRAGISLWASLAGGMIVSLAPHRLSQMCGHINGLFYFSFPMLLYFGEGMARSPKKRYPVLLGLTLVLMAWTEYHMFYYTALFLMPYGLFLLKRIAEPRSGAAGEGKASLLSLLEGAGVGIGVAVIALQKGWPYHRAYPALVPLFAVGFYFLLGVFAGIISGFTGTGEERARGALASLFLPLVLLSFYPVKLWVSIPQFGHLLFAAVVVLLGVQAFRLRGNLAGRGLEEAVARRVAGRFIPLLPLGLLAGGIVIAIKKFVLGGTIAERGRRLAEVRYFSPRWDDLFHRLNYQGESMLYLGVAAGALLILCAGVFAWRRRRGGEGDGADAQVVFWLGVFFLATFLSLGLSVSRVPLYAFFYQVVPFFKYPRVPGRIIFISYAALAFCAAWGLDRFPLPRGAWKKGLILAAALGIAVDYFPPRPIGLCLLERGPTVYDGMKRDGMPPRTLLELPIWPGDSAWSTLYQYYVTRYGYPMVNGYSPVVAKDYVDKVFYGLYPMDVGEATGKVLPMLKRLHVKYVTFHANAYPYKISPFPAWMTLKRLRALPFLKEVRSSDDKTLFRVSEGSLPGKFDARTLEAIDSPVGVLWEAERSRHLVGKVIPDPRASAGKALASFKRGKRGMMMGNQHRFFPAGWYEGLVRIKTWKEALPSKSATLGAVVVMGRHRKRTLVMKVISTGDLKPDAYTDIRFAFHVHFAQKIECIVYTNGTVPLCLDYAYIAFTGRGEGPGTFQAEDLFHYAPVRPLPSGNGKGVRFSPDVLNDRSIWGPLHRLDPGRYRAVFWMAAEGGGAPGSPAALIQVARGHQRTVLVSRALKHGDWDAPGKLKPFSLAFSLDRPAIIQLPVYYQGRGILYVDRIEVAKEPGP